MITRRNALPTLVLLLASAGVAGAQTTKPTHPAPAAKVKPPVNTRSWPDLVFIDVADGDDARQDCAVAAKPVKKRLAHQSAGAAGRQIERR